MELRGPEHDDPHDPAHDAPSPAGAGSSVRSGTAVRSMCPVRRNITRMIASATVISAAAMVMTKRVRTGPAESGAPGRLPAVTSSRLAALRMSSTPMRTRTALRRARTP